MYTKVKYHDAATLLQDLQSGAATITIDDKPTKSASGQGPAKNANGVYETVTVHYGKTVSPLWVVCTGITITRAFADPSDSKDARNSHPSKRFCIQTTLAQSGAFGMLLAYVNNHVQTRYNNSPPQIKNRVRFNEALQTSVREGEAYGTVILDPIIRIKYSFDRFPSNHPIPHLREKIKTTFYDGRNISIVNGTPSLTELKVESPSGPVPLSDQTIRDAVPRGSIIIYAVIDMSAVVRTSSYYGLSFMCHQAAIIPSAENSVDDAAGLALLSSYVNERVANHN